MHDCSQSDPVDPADDVLAGQAVYSGRVLRLYDWLVLGISNRWIWRSPTSRLLAHYDHYVTGNHLDVGVGTGYFLDRCRFPVPQPRVALMDLNENCLKHAAIRIARYLPKTYRRNILEPIPFDEEPFDSIGLNYVLHCLPGEITVKACLFDHLQALLNPGGVIFGSTLLASGVPRSRMARRLMDAYNQRGVFANAGDSREALEDALRKRFEEWRLETIGCAALFQARRR